MLDEHINNVINKYEREMNSATTTDQVHKLYRHIRIWNRINCYYGGVYSPEVVTKLNKEFKSIYAKRLSELS